MKSPGRFLVLVGLCLLVMRVLACHNDAQSPGDGGDAGPATCYQGPSGSTAPCDSPSICDGTKCLTRALAPTGACSTPMDCGAPGMTDGGGGGSGGGLPSPICVGPAEQMIFTDPSCDEGQCHWRQIVNVCTGEASRGGIISCASGQCFNFGPAVLTGGPLPPVPTLDPSQPPTPDAQACATAGDCHAPSPSCFDDSVVNYVNPSCPSGACVWEFDLIECGSSCSAGACTGP